MPDERRIHFPPFALDLVNECLWSDTRAIKLRPKAFAVLQMLLSRPGELVSKEHLLRTVWDDAFVGDAVLKVTIRQIRAALADDPRAPRFIETAHRRGYRFVGTLSDAGTVHSPGGPFREAAGQIVGRARALSQMHGWLAQARRGGCQVVFVTGEAGIGKTTLIDTFAREIAAAGVRVCSGQCLEQYGMGEAYLPVLDAIRQLCRDDPEVVGVLRAHAPKWLAQIPALMSAADRDSFGRDTGAATREQMLGEMGDALDALTANGVLVLLLEDLHWSDLSTLDLISYVARRRRRANLMLVGTYRPADLLANRHPLRSVKQELAAKQQCEELALELLTRDAVAEYVAARLPGHQLPDAFVSLIHDRTEGSPLFLVSTIDHLLAEGVIGPHDAGWRLTVPIDALKVGVPESIRQLIDTSFERLDPREQRILEAASVAGMDFPTAAVSAALDEAGTTDVEARCEELARRHQFIRSSGTHLLPDGQHVGRFAFVHSVYRRVLYERIAKPRRTHLHRRVAERGEEVYGLRVPEIAAELAMHFEKAADYPRAAHHLRQAALNAMHRAAYREAIALSRRGLNLLTRLPDTDERARQELRLQMTLGLPLMVTEGYAAPEVGEVYRRARALCDRGAEVSELSHVLWSLWTFHALKAELATAATVARELLDLAGRAADRGVAMRAHWAMEITKTHLGNFRAALEHFKKALPLYESSRGMADGVLDALNPGVSIRCFAAWCLWFLGWPETALADMQHAVAQARELGEPHALAHALTFAAVLHQLRGERPLTHQYAAEAAAITARHGLPLYEAMARVLEGWAALGRGDDQSAATGMRDGLDAWESTGARLMRPHFLTLIAEASPVTVVDDRGLQALTDALALGESTGERWYHAEACRLRGERLAAAAVDDSQRRAAETCFERSLEIARAQEARSLELRAAMSLARFQHGTPGAAFARTRLRRVYDQFEEGFETIDLRGARALLEAPE